MVRYSDSSKHKSVIDFFFSSSIAKADINSELEVNLKILSLKARDE